MVTCVPGHSDCTASASMRAIVPDQFQRAGVVAGDEFNLRIVLDCVGQIGNRAIQRHAVLAGAKCLGDIGAGCFGG